MARTSKPKPADEIAVLGSMSQTAAAWLVSRTPRALRDSDCPREPDGRYNARAVIEWLMVSRETTGDPLLDSGDGSAALERYRAAKAELAEIDIAERKRQLIPRDLTRVWMGRLAGLLRNMGDRLGRRYGKDAQIAVNDTLSDFDRLVADAFLTNEPISAS